MNLTVALLLTLVGALPVEATTLDGVAVEGELSSLSSQSATIQVDGNAEELPVANLHLLRLHEAPGSRQPPMQVQLRDGSQIALEQVELSARSAMLTTKSLGPLELARTDLASLRLARLDSQVESAWNDLIQRESRDDVVVVRKGDALDHVEGVISGIDGEAVRLLLDGSPVPIPRDRVFGVVLAAADPKGAKAVGRLDLSGGDRLAIASVVLENEAFAVQLAAGPRVVIAPEDLARIDFSLGKIAYLSDMEPMNVVYPTEHELFLLDVWKYRRGENSMSHPLEVGHKTYERGLWIHSGTTLSYRLNKEYRRLRAVAGIAEGIGESCQPTIGLVLRGDGKELLNVSITRGDDPRELDVDVADVRELQIEVTSTDPDGICEHLGLGDVRVIK